MSRDEERENGRELATWEGDGEIQRVEVSAVGVLTKSEVEAQLDAAHKYPRRIKRFLDEAMELATYSKDVAKKCQYAVTRSGKPIVGPSVRLAEIVASAYGNMHVAARVIDETERSVVGQAVCWDLEKNLRISVEAQRRITTKDGKRYGDDMIITTGNAAISIALRNAVFRVVPRVHVQTIFEASQRAMVGDLKTIGQRRQEIAEGLGRLGVPVDRIVANLDGRAMVDWGVEELSLLVGIGNAINSKGMTIDEAFPILAGAPKIGGADAPPEGRRVSIGKAKPDAAKTPAPSDAKKDATPPSSPGDAKPGIGADGQPEPPDGVLDTDAKPSGREPGSDG